MFQQNTLDKLLQLLQLRKEFPQLNAMPSLWTRNYFVSTACNVSSETITQGIREFTLADIVQDEPTR